jgi:hypothetical protein
VIATQRTKNFNILYNLNDQKLEDDERLHLWKRKDEDLVNLKSKIFLCLSEAEHCTFEPKINKNENDMRILSKEDIINKRISNKAWVGKMGENFSTRFPLKYKEGVLKKVNNMFMDGKFSEVLKILEEAFELDPIRAHFDPKFNVIYKKRLEDEVKKKNEENMKEGGNKKIHNIHDLLFAHHVGGEKKKVPEKDDFANMKNRQLCLEVYDMLKIMDHYKKNKLKAAKRIKDEIHLVETTKLEIKNGKSVHDININVSSNVINLQDTGKTGLSKVSVHTIHQENYIKDRYFKFFKTLMCPLK